MNRDKQFILLSYLFPPAGGSQAAASIRLGKIAYYINYYGWRPIVISADVNSYPKIDNTIIPTNNLSIYRVKDPLPIFRGRNRIARFIPSPGDLLPWLLNVVVKTIALINKHDCRLIFASSPPSADFLAAYLVHMFTKKPLILDYRDQWFLSPYRMGPKIYKYWDYFLEKELLRAAEKVVVTNNGRGIEHKKIWGKFSPDVIVINNGIDPSDFYFTELQNIQLKKNNANKILIRHLGAIYGPREEILKQFLTCLENYSLNNELPFAIEIELIGYVPENILSKKQNSPNLVYKKVENVTYREAIQLEISADLLLLIIGKHASSSAEVSSKIYEYIYCKRPIIIIGRSKQLEELLSERKSVMLVGDNINDQMIEKMINWYIRLDITTIQEDFQLLSKQIEENFDRREQAKELANLFNSVSMSNSGAN